MNRDLKKGIIYGIIGNIFVSFQPIIANSRPQNIDAHLFASMTVLIEALVFLPIMIIELKIKNGKSNKESNTTPKITLLKKWKNHIWFFIFVGFIFGLNQLLYFLGYQLAGAINGSLTQKTTVFFGIIFGFFILKEQVNKIQIIFSIVLFIGLAIAITRGSIFFIIDLKFGNFIGVLIILLISCLWMYGHTITKPFFNRKEVTSSEMVFMRNFLSFLFLFPTYLIFNPIENLNLLLNPINQFYYVIFGVVYASGLFCWYQSLSLLDVSKATILFSFTPIGTAIFASFILGELFTIYHLIGTLIVIISIFFIMKQKS